MFSRSFTEHMDPAVGPKRILALDGGGLRGVLTIAFLQKIEDILRERHGGDADFRLCDYYDLIGGTSTGSIIAAGLAIGMSVAEIREQYFRLGAHVFKRSIFSHGYLSQQYDAGKVSAALKGIFGERTLGSGDFRTGLMVMCKRLDTGSQWPLTNNPKSRYFDIGSNPHTVPNKDYPLWSVIRASTAAPTYFEPESILIKAANPDTDTAAVKGEFIDGGVSTANNPSLQLLLMATVKSYGFGWQTGEDNLELTSLGTGRANQNLGLSTGLDSIVALGAVKALKSVLDNCEDMVETMMQWMSHSPTARAIDREIGTLAGGCAGAAPLLKYHRYNVHFEPAWFKEQLGQVKTRRQLDDLAEMDRPENMRLLEQIGKQAAALLIVPEYV